jgi:Protein of unknown function (DUF3237)
MAEPTPEMLSDLPETLRAVHTAPLFVLRLAVRPIHNVGATPGAHRRVGIVYGGDFSGSRLAGEVIDGGSDWQAVQSDGTTTLDVRLLLRTTGGELIAMSYRGIRHGPAEVLRRVDSGEAVDPAEYYFRINPQFETASAPLGWLNRILSLGIGYRRADGVVYSIFEVK